QAQRHDRVRLALVLDEHSHQRRLLGLAGAEGDAEEQVQLVLLPVLQAELAVDQLGAGAVEAAGQVGQDLGQQVGEVAGGLQQPADGPVGELVRPRVVIQGHHGSRAWYPAKTVGTSRVAEHTTEGTSSSLSSAPAASGA